MYLGIDLGGSKTLLASFTQDGKLTREHKFPTNPNYKTFLKDLEVNLKINFSAIDFDRACCAVPGRVNRQNGVAEDFGSLKWHNVPIKKDISKITSTPVSVENDANLAGLSEALLVHKKYKRVLYITISTGIGSGIIVDGSIDPALADSEAGQMILPHDDQLQAWEDFASGSALYKKYGKLASEIEDEHIWKRFGRDVGLGLYEMVAVVQPQIIVIGGGVGAHLEKFIDFIDLEIDKHPNDMVQVPPIVKAKRPEEAVIYGCYDYIKQNT